MACFNSNSCMEESTYGSCFSDYDYTKKGMSIQVVHGSVIWIAIGKTFFSHAID